MSHHVQETNGTLDADHFHTTKILDIPQTDFSIDRIGNELEVAKRV